MANSYKKKESVVSKRYIVDQIYSRLDGAISKDVIYQAITVIVDEMHEMILNKEQISISNFGTIDPYLQHGHKGIDVTTGEIVEHKPVWRVKFLTNYSFKKILLDSIKKFKNS